MTARQLHGLATSSCVCNGCVVVALDNHDDRVLACPDCASPKELADNAQHMREVGLLFE